MVMKLSLDLTEIRRFHMKIIKLIGIITVTMVVMFAMTGCDEFFGTNDPDDNGGNSGGGSGGTSTVPTITIRNNTGYTINGIYIKASTSTSWGSNLWGFSSLSNGTTREFTLSQPLSVNREYDIRLDASSGGHQFRKYMVTVSNNMTITFTQNDLNDRTDLPTITIVNRSGVNFSAIHIKPSVSSDWGASFGTVSNNSNQTVTIPIPPSSIQCLIFR